MKKYLLIVAVIALGLSFSACGGKKTADAEPVQEEVIIVDETVDETDVLVKFGALIDKLIDVQGKVAGGDLASVEELSGLNEEVTLLGAELQNAAADFTPEQTQKYAELVQKLADFATKNAQP